ncbi:Type I restriction-modification system methyltransferase subunit [Limihaloglobus sulfuriphilus]|uniref:Type I restriction-modification system methyltransferase subunit n=1 Tax=Limihaloglobus sulfuriphilus TaxID=1851148 RepID=A0A1Q2MGU1_9BACT|nr:N-6 DNA methylase [Limihaloglobus sulfuriphilus]AQQ71900.1 Type I restriction-modification system methyltransferase subunit [Limihaloglobus sulfuriphilus]
MSTAKLRYNERSWAIDLISHINSLLPKVNLSIKRASGENTLKTGKNLLFPDVLLYSSKSHGHVLQGWELKMPDTPIDDTELIGNAKKKAIALQLNSYVVWNVKTANLYILNEVSNEYELYPEPLYHNGAISTRNDVSNKPDLWKNAAYDILAKIDRLFEGGRISGVAPGVMFSNDGIINQLLSCHAEVKLFIENEIQRDSAIDAKVDVWWRQVKHQYPGEDSPASPLAYHVLLRWFNRFVFSNILKAYTSAVKDVERIQHETTVHDALKVFSEISNKSNYSNIFQKTDFDTLVPDEVWSTLVGFNHFLREFEFAKIDKKVLHSILHCAVLSSIKKGAGLYVTPEPLAHFLVRLTLSDKSAVVIDPFCGTGTILNAILSTKSDYHITGREAFKQTWGADKFAFPVQISTLAMLAPEAMNEILQIFTHDVFDLHSGKEIDFIDPSTGNNIKRHLPKFSAIISNLPFVRFEDIKKLNLSAKIKIKEFYDKYNIPTAEQLDGRSDLLAYIPFKVYDLLDDGGYLGVVVSNSWLPATGWGQKFRDLLRKFYTVKYVVTSGSGKWFDNADVVANLLICQKKNMEDECCETSFVTTLCSIEDCELDDLKLLVSEILIDQPSDYLSVNKPSVTEVDQLRCCNIGWNFCFSEENFKWFLPNIDKFEKLSFYCKISRGNRTGWNKLFYPRENECYNIETEFLKPFIKDIRTCKKLVVSSSQQVFCCSMTEDELADVNKQGAIRWINRFKDQTTIVKGKRITIPEKLLIENPNLSWYEIDTSKLADFIISMSPDSRLFVPKPNEPAFVDQRLISLTVTNESVNESLLHALLNSIYVIGLIEAIGFGRGLGVLDINTRNIRAGLHVPKIELISKDAEDSIKISFAKLKLREVKPILEELRDPIRVEFDTVVTEAIGLSETDRLAAYDGLTKLYNIRKSVGR